MKRIINLVIVVFGAVFLSSCSTTGSMMTGSAGSGYLYYDNVYNYGYPSYYGVNPYLFPRNRIIHNKIIVVPEKRKVNNRDHVRRRAIDTPNSRRKNISTPDRSVERSTSPARRGSKVAPSSRRSSSPANRGSSRSGSRRGGDQ